MSSNRNTFYINANLDERYFFYTGIEFQEFLKCCPIELNNILLLHNCFSDNHNHFWNLNAYNGKEAISELLKENIYNLGNFHWIDYNSEDNLNSCTPEEQAEVLYLSHFWKPLKTPFFDRIHNNFAYLSHDDGWYCVLYCKDVLVFKDILAGKIINTFAADKRRKILPMAEDIKDYLYSLTNKGLLIDFPNAYQENGCIGVKFYVISKYSNMHDIYNNREKGKQTAEICGLIEYKNKMWSIKAL